LLVDQGATATIDSGALQAASLQLDGGARLLPMPNSAPIVLQSAVLSIGGNASIVATDVSVGGFGVM
jgi:hypothetical protein